MPSAPFETADEVHPLTALSCGTGSSMTAHSDDGFEARTSMTILRRCRSILEDTIARTDTPSRRVGSCNGPLGPLHNLVNLVRNVCASQRARYHARTFLFLRDAYAREYKGGRRCAQSRPRRLRTRARLAVSTSVLRVVLLRARVYRKASNRSCAILVRNRGISLGATGRPRPFPHSGIKRRSWRILARNRGV